MTLAKWPAMPGFEPDILTTPELESDARHHSATTLLFWQSFILTFNPYWAPNDMPWLISCMWETISCHLVSFLSSYLTFVTSFVTGVPVIHWSPVQQGQGRHLHRVAPHDQGHHRRGLRRAYDLWWPRGAWLQDHHEPLTYPTVEFHWSYPPTGEMEWLLVDPFANICPPPIFITMHLNFPYVFLMCHPSLTMCPPPFSRPMIWPRELLWI